MHAFALDEDPYQREFKTRKPKRNTTSNSTQNDRHSIKDPKIFKQLVKNSEKHEITKLIGELKDEMKNKRKLSSAHKQTTLPPEANPDIDLDQHVVSVKIPIPKEFEERFLKDFQEYMVMYKQVFQETDMVLEPLDIGICDDPEFLKLLAKMYYLCEENFYEANAIQLWRDLPKCFSRKELLLMEEKPRDFYTQYLFLFDRFSKIEPRNKESLINILKFDPVLLTDPHIRYAQGLTKQDLTPEFFQEVSQKQCALLKDFVNLLEFDHELFSIENIIQNHPDDQIDVMYQNPDLYGFVQDTKKTLQTRKKISIHEYGDYQRECMARMPQNMRDSHGMIKFAVNIDIEDWEDHMKHLAEKVPPFWLYNSEHDGMGFINQKIKGVNLPQIYLKVEGAWTGGHEENLRLRAINFNHGPDSCVWYTIGTEYVPKFRQLVKEKYGLDIHKDEGLWFGDIDLCIKNDIKVQYFVQEPGDIVLLGPGCLHWVRCLGITMNSAWNYCGKDKFQFEKAFERMSINNEINFRNLIPVKHIAWEILKHDTFKINAEFRRYLAETLIKFFDDELEKYSQFNKNHSGNIFTYEHDGSSVYNCVMCQNETLNFYVYCDACSRVKKPKKISHLVCLGCYEEHLKICKGHEKKPYPYCKLTENLLEKVREVLKNIEEEVPKMKQSYKSLGEWIKEMVNEEKIALENNEQHIEHKKKHHGEKPQLNQENHGHSMKREESKTSQEDKIEEETSTRVDEATPVSQNEQPGKTDEIIAQEHQEQRMEIEPEPEAEAQKEEPVQENKEKEKVSHAKKKKPDEKAEKVEKEKVKVGKSKQSTTDKGKAKASTSTKAEGILEEADEKRNRTTAVEEEGTQKKRLKTLEEINAKRKQSHHNELKDAVKNGAHHSHNKSPPTKKHLFQEKPQKVVHSEKKTKSFSLSKEMNGSKGHHKNEYKVKENSHATRGDNQSDSESDGETYQIKKKTKGSDKDENNNMKESKELSHNKETVGQTTKEEENYFIKNLSK